MAISFVGSFGDAVASSDTTFNFSSLKDSSNGTPTLQEGDLVLVHVNNRNTTNSAPVVLTSGYSSVYANIYENDTNDTNLSTFYKFMGATPDTSVTVESLGFSNVAAACIQVLRGVDQTTPFDGVTPTSATGTDIGHPDSPSITPSTAGAWIVAVGAVAAGTGAGDTIPLTNPANLDSTTNFFVTGSNTRSEVGAGLFSGWTSGAFNPGAFGGGGQGAVTNQSWGAVTFVLKPAEEAGGETQDLDPSLVTNTSSFFGPTVTARFTVAPSLVTNTSSFNSPTATATAAILPGLFTNSVTFFAALVGTAGEDQDLTPSLFTNSNTVFDHEVELTYELDPALFTNSQSFFGPTVSFKVFPGLFTNSSSFFGPTITGEGGISPTLFTNTNTFFAATIGGSYNLTASKVTNTSSLFAPSATTSNTLRPSLLTNTPSFFDATLTQGHTVTIISPDFVVLNENKFFEPAVTLSFDQLLIPLLMTNYTRWFTPSITSLNPYGPRKEFAVGIRLPMNLPQ